MIDHARQLARFSAVSLFCFALGLGVLTGLHELCGVHYLVAYVASFVATSSLGYVLNGQYTFRARGGDRAGLLRYMLVNVTLLVINGMALRVLVEHFHVWYLSATLLLAALNTPVSFVAHRLVSYRLGLGRPRLSPANEHLGLRQSRAVTASTRSTDARRASRRLALDVMLWCSIPLAFLLVYVGHFARSAASVIPHLRLVALPLLALLLLRLTLARLKVTPNIARAVNSLTMASLLALLLVYYCLVIIGLGSWGGVVAWNVIPTFFAQTSVMADALGIPPLLVIAALLVVYAGIVVGCWSYLRRFDGLPELAARLSGSMFIVLIASGATVLTMETYQFSRGAGTLADEPLSLTLFPPTGALDLEGYSVNPVTASRMDQVEKAARAAYVPAPAAHRNLVVIVVDALRPDHMSLYGYGRDTTPNLARIASEQPTRIISGVHSSCGDTICSLYSLFSSRFPREFSLAPFTLQEVLRRNGYRIHLVLSGDHTYFHTLRNMYGPVDTFFDGTQAKGYFLNDDRLLVDHVAAMPAWDGVPAMFQFHLMSAHILRRGDVVPGKFQPAARYLFKDARDTGAGGHVEPTAVNFYDNGVVSADSIINSLLETLRSKGYLRDALVVITADHGESLGEHGLFHHANSVREELLRIPLVLISYGYQPQLSARTRKFPAEVDIAPTLLTELGLPHPRSWSGRPLQQADGPEFSYFDEHTFAGLIDHRDPDNLWKYWIDTKSGEDHAFNLSTDPHEDHDVRGVAPAQRLSDWRTLTLAATSVALDGR
ncbi:MAG: hypothetical protein JWL65_2411 [Gammaproteobacteria bacterium]|nr:hypothetical protein [Gammaproteobacteria bacterium]